MTHFSLDPHASRNVTVTGAATADRDAKAHAIRELAKTLRLEPHSATSPKQASGWPALDELLGGGLPTGALIECFGGLGDGRSSFAAAAISQTLRAAPDKIGLLIDPHRQWYAPGLLQAGVPLRRVWWIAPATEAETLWTLEQALTSKAVGVVVASVGRLDLGMSRRLQLAAESGGGLVLLFRPRAEYGVRTVGPIQLGFEAVGTAEGRGEWEMRAGEAPAQTPARALVVGEREVRITVLRCRGGLAGCELDLRLTPHWPDDADDAGDADDTGGTNETGTSADPDTGAKVDIAAAANPDSPLPLAVPPVRHGSTRLSPLGVYRVAAVRHRTRPARESHA